MGTRRMFTQKITESDAFLEMPASTQAYYFHLCMNADDDGFVKNPKIIARMIGASEDDGKILIAKRFIIPFESGVIVIKHWRMHNLLRKDRYTETEYIEEKSQLYLKENGSYTLDENQGERIVATKWQPDDNQTTTQVSIGKDNIGNKENIIKEIFDFWNKKNIIVHRELTVEIIKSIEKCLKTYTEEQIKTYIDRYNQVIKDKNYFFDYKWTLKDFLSRKDGISAFTDEGSKWINYNMTSRPKVKYEDGSDYE